LLNDIQLRALPHSLFELPSENLTENPEPFALVSIQTYLTLSAIRPPWPTTQGFGPISIYPFKRPVNPLEESGQNPDDTNAAEGEPAPKVIHTAGERAQPVPSGNGDASVNDETEKKGLETVVIRWCRAIPSEQVLLFNVQSVNDWEPW
jgi:hypothetical protein